MLLLILRFSQYPSPFCSSFLTFLSLCLTCLPLNSIWKFFADSCVTRPPKSSWYTWEFSFQSGALLCITYWRWRGVEDPELSPPLPPLPSLRPRDRRSWKTEEVIVWKKGKEMSGRKRREQKLSKKDNCNYEVESQPESFEKGRNFVE